MDRVQGITLEKASSFADQCKGLGGIKAACKACPERWARNRLHPCGPDATEHHGGRGSGDHNGDYRLGGCGLVPRVLGVHQGGRNNKHCGGLVGTAPTCVRGGIPEGMFKAKWLANALRVVGTWNMEHHDRCREAVTITQGQRSSLAWDQDEKRQVPSGPDRATPHSSSNATTAPPTHLLQCGGRTFTRDRQPRLEKKENAFDGKLVKCIRMAKISSTSLEKMNGTARTTGKEKGKRGLDRGGGESGACWFGLRNAPAPKPRRRHGSVCQTGDIRRTREQETNKERHLNWNSRDWVRDGLECLVEEGCISEQQRTGTRELMQAVLVQEGPFGASGLDDEKPYWRARYNARVKTNTPRTETPGLPA
ncbi:MAG: hypothetical protein M1816_001960 [Peltula sp. TS41687]|nr:MAG: hypothetical protein M1816_001960 [Peltula sp. TS41687]